MSFTSELSMEADMTAKHDQGHRCRRILERLGAEVRVFNPEGLPMKDEASTSHPKVEEIRALSLWSEAQVSTHR